MDELVIYGRPADNGGCGHYRVTLPLQEVALNGLAKVHLDDPKVDKDDRLTMLQTANVVVCQRPRSKEMANFFRLVRQKHDPDTLTVFEHDDNTWDTNPLSDHHRWHAMWDIAVPIEQAKRNGMYESAIAEGKTVKDGLVWLWEHGHNGVDMLENRDNMRQFNTCLALADVVTCTTPKLAKLFRKKAKLFGNPHPRVHWLPNCLDLRMWMPIETVHDDIKILWQGGASHYPDLVAVKEALRIICQKFPQVTLVFGGIGPAGIVDDINPKQVEVYDNWVEFSAHPYRTALYQADIAIAPLADLEFNTYKSDIKYTEYSALKIPTVASDMTPYKESIDHGKTGFLAGNTQEWVKHLSALVQNAQLRKTIGKAARKWVEENRDIRKEAHRWSEIYAKELKHKKASTPS